MCAFDTLDLAKAEEHDRLAHQEQFPLVSCITPTRNRPQFIERAIRCFRSQTYPRLEMIVVADGERLELPNGIRYIHCDPRVTIGTARNIACAAAKGKYIVHFDDDDWSHPERVAYQIALLRKTNAQICGLRRLWVGQPNDPTQLEFVNNVIVGCTLAFPRKSWCDIMFEDISDAEDTAFVQRFEHIAELDMPWLFRYRLHMDAYGDPRRANLYPVKVDPKWTSNKL